MLLSKARSVFCGKSEVFGSTCGNFNGKISLQLLRFVFNIHVGSVFCLLAYTYDSAFIWSVVNLHASS